MIDVAPPDVQQVYFYCDVSVDPYLAVVGVLAGPMGIVGAQQKGFFCVAFIVSGLIGVKVRDSVLIVDRPWKRKEPLLHTFGWTFTWQ